MVQALPRYRKEKPQPQPGWVRPLRDVFRNPETMAAMLPKEWHDFEAFCAQTSARTSDGITGFKLYQWQKEFTELVEQRDSVLTKSRQTGASQWLIAYALWKALMTPGFSVVIFSKSFQDVSDLARRMRRAIQGLGHPCAKPRSDSLSLVQLPNDSEIRFRSANPPEKAGRGIDGVNLLILDEASWYEDLGQNLGNMQATLAVSKDPRLVLTSTPNGRNGAYWEKLVEGIGEPELEKLLQKIRDRKSKPCQAIIPEKGFAKYITHWSSIPNLTAEEDFEGRMQSSMPLDKWKREFELDFSEADSSIFDRELINAQEDLDWVSKEPEPWGIYLHGCDPSGSTGRDFFTSVVLKLTPSTGAVEYVDIYKENTGSYEQHAQAVVEQLHKYKPVHSSIELNSMGAVIREQVEAACPGVVVGGVFVTMTKKEQLISRLLMAMQMGLMSVPPAIADEMRVFVRKPSGRLEAGPGPINDDAISATAQAMAEWNPFLVTQKRYKQEDENDW